ncbi:hypothetical protein F2Q69_00000903 [Brassica cretica]|uniref:Replication factor A C-terminal domain-containing protein n=1 Tax=Brassica cretica TaxID=69181 RepID=A0A8S9PAG3_BRACR|nr:hypothetical protein F2Q69_00000903 [Brassica cretica]
MKFPSPTLFRKPLTNWFYRAWMFSSEIWSNFLSGQAFTIVGLTHSKKQSTGYKIEFLCTAKKTGVQPYNVWCYIGCSKCSKKLLREISSFTCMFCEKTDAEGCLRYRVELSLSYHANIVSGQVTARDSAPVFKNNGQIN